MTAPSMPTTAQVSRSIDYSSGAATMTNADDQAAARPCATVRILTASGDGLEA